MRNVGGELDNVILEGATGDWGSILSEVMQGMSEANEPDNHHIRCRAHHRRSLVDAAMPGMLLVLNETAVRCRLDGLPLTPNQQAIYLRMKNYLPGLTVRSDFSILKN